MRDFRAFVRFCLVLVCGLALPDIGLSATAGRPAPQTPEQKTSDLAAVQSQAAAKSPVAAKNVPTRITADGMSYEADAQQVMFTKNVHVKRPDFEMWADKITVYLKPANKKESAGEGAAAIDSLAVGEIDRIVAAGNVRMKRDKNTSTSGKATYTMDTAVLALEDNPRLTDGENVITGEVIRYFMNENRSDVLSGPKKRVEAVFITSDKPTREGH
jgi:lipopolysaccharide export system protein LptA